MRRIDTRSRSASVVLASVAFCSGLLASAPAVSDELARAAVAPIAAGAAQGAGESAPASGKRPYNRQVLRQFAVRNRRYESDLARARRLLEDGHPRDAIGALQSLLDKPEDTFLSPSDAGRFVSMRRLVESLLSILPAEDFAFYEKRYGGQAEQLLEDANSSREWWICGEVIRRYGLTDAGYRARLILAERWADRGDVRTAARVWREIVANVVHHRRLDEPALQRGLIIAAAASDNSLRQSLLAELRRKNPQSEFLSSDPSKFGEIARPGAKAIRDFEWPMLMGDAPRIRSSSATAPYLDPAWLSPLAAAQPVDELIDEIADWSLEQDSEAKPRAIANSAIFAGGQVVVRDLDGIRSLDPKAGAVRWTFPGTATYRNISPFGGAPGPRVATGRLEISNIYAESTVLGTLSSDGLRVFAVDAGELSLSRGTFREARAVDANNPNASSWRSANFLVALDLAVESGPKGPPKVNPVWRIGGMSDAGAKPSGPLAGHFFLGAPLPSDGRLFAMSEHDGQLNLSMLDAATGRVVWTQGLGYADRSIENDAFRAVKGCVPALSEEIVVCPTQLGVLVGVSAETGSLQWVYYCGDDPSDTATGAYNFGGRIVLGHEGFPTIPHIQRGRVVHLPVSSRDVHCVDLTTGDSLWTSPRLDGQYIGAVTDDLVLVVGSRTCRALGLSDGRERWSARTGIPSGVGLRSGSHYLLPLDDGRVFTLDLATRREVGLSVARHSPPDAASPPSAPDESPESDAGKAHSPVDYPPGNPIPAGDLLVSTGVFGLVAYRQSGRVLEDTIAQLRRNPADATLRLREAELTLQTGDSRRAAPMLRSLLGGALDDAPRQHAEHLLREILYADLSTASATGSDRILKELDAISRTPASRGRFLIQKVEWQLKSGEPDAVLQSAIELAGLQGRDPIPFAGNPQHLVAAGAWVPAILQRLQGNAPANTLARLNADIDREAQRALRGDEAGLQRFLSVYGRWPQADAVRLRLADLHLEAGQQQQAELLYLECRKSRDPETVATATGSLVRLWDRAGLWHEAARLIAQASKNAPAEAARRSAPEEWLAQLPADSLTHSALRQLAPPGWPVTRVRITEDRFSGADNRIDEAFIGYRRKYQMPSDSSFHLLDKGATDKSKPGDSRAAVIDRHTGTIAGNLTLPARNSYPTYGRPNHAGHFFTMGTEGEAVGVSLLTLDDDQPLWRTPLVRAGSSGDVARVGPVGPTFSTFQAKRLLTVLNPADGRVIWERRDLEPNAGLISDPGAGLFGDGEVLVVFGGDSTDRREVTIYRTATGEELRKLRIDVDTSLPRRPLGRRFLYTTNGDPERRLRLWDPVGNIFLLNEPADDRPQTYLIGDEELAVLLPSNRLRVRDLDTMEVRLDMPLRPDDLLNLSTFRVFRDTDSYYVNFQREMRAPFTQTFSHHVDNAFIPTVPVSGDLYAVERGTGRVRWKRFLPQRSFVDLPHHRLPFLIAISRQRDRAFNARQSLLVEVIDKATGETIGHKENILSDRLVVFSYDPRAARIELRGLETMIRIEFGREVQRFPGAEPRESNLRPGL